MTNQQTTADYEAAAKRLRDVSRGNNPYSPGEDDEQKFHLQYGQDIRILVRLALSELDETPVDDLWLVSVGGERLSGGWVVSLGPLLFDNHGGLSLDENELPIRTRGELRALCRALRIPLKEV